MLELALYYAARGFAVFPVHTSRNGICSCGKDCGRNNGKHPRTRRGHLDATRDEDQIRQWWSECPDANIAIATGMVSNLFVVDLDSRDGVSADERLAQLRGTFGDLSVTLMVRTGSGGLHVWFRMPEDGKRVPSSQKKVGPGTDIRADGGYVVAPGSMHKSGQKYVFVEGRGLDDVPLAPAPDKIVEKARGRAADGETKKKAPTYVTSPTRSPSQAPVASAPLTDEDWDATVELVAPAWPSEAGLRHPLAMALAHILDRAGVPAEDVPELVGEIARAAGDEDEIENRDRSKAAFDALQEEQGYGWPFVREMAPEVHAALQACPAVQRNVPACIQEDLDEVSLLSVLTPERARAEIRQALESATRDFVTGIAGCAGSGKTVATIEVAIDRARRGLKTGIVVPTYKLLWEYVKALNEAAAPWQAVISVTAKNADGDPFCNQTELVEQLARSGWSARTAACWKCPTRKACPARLGHVGDRNALIVLGTHQQIGEVSRRAGPDGLIVVDECVAIWKSEKLSMGALKAASAAAVRVVPPSCPSKRAIIAAMDRMVQYAASKEPGISATIESVLGPVCDDLKGVRQTDIVPDVSDDDNVAGAADLGAVLRLILPAVENPDVVIEVTDKGGRGIVVHGPDVGFLDGFRSVTVPMVFLDATMDADEVRKITGKPVREIRFTLPDSAPVTRTVVVYANGVRKHMLLGGKPFWKNIVGPFRDIVSRVQAAGAKSVLLVSYKPVAEAMKQLLNRNVVPLDAATRNVKDLLEELQYPDDQPKRKLYIEHYPLRGTNNYETTDMIVTLGDPWDNKDAAKYGAAWLGLPLDRTYRKRVRSQLEQAHGRGRPAQRKTPLTCVHYGTVVPGSWTGAQREPDGSMNASMGKVTIARLAPPGRPRKLTPEMVEKIGVMRSEGFTLNEISTALGVSIRTVQNARAEITTRKGRADALQKRGK